MPPGPLIAATRAAHDGVSADQALLAEGPMREDEFYRLLARHLGAPYYRAEMTIGPCDPGQGRRQRHRTARPERRGIALRAGAARPGADAAARRAEAVAARLRHLFAAKIGRRGSPPDGAPPGAGGGRRPRAARSGVVGAGGPEQRPVGRRCACWSLPRRRSARCNPKLWPRYAPSASMRRSRGRSRCALRRWPPARRRAPFAPLDERDLPVYSIIAPLLSRSKVAPRLIDALDAIDYPRPRLDIKIVIERDDRKR